MALITFLICTMLICAAHSVQSEVPKSLKKIGLRKGGETMKPTDSSSDLAAAIAGCGCSKIYDPVCASNDKSYYNPCQMECEIIPDSAVYIKHQGNCVPY